MSSYYKLDYHTHCSHCGGKIVKGKTWISYYDHDHGYPVYRSYWQCENWRWWKVFSYHFKEEFEGEDMIVNYDYM